MFRIEKPFNKLEALIIQIYFTNNGEKKTNFQISKSINSKLNRKGLQIYGCEMSFLDILTL